MQLALKANKAARGFENAKERNRGDHLIQFKVAFLLDSLCLNRQIAGWVLGFHARIYSELAKTYYG